MWTYCVVRVVEVNRGNYDLERPMRLYAKVSSHWPRIENNRVSYRSPSCTIWSLVLPLAVSSRLIRMTAAEVPIMTAKMGSATLEIMYVAGIISAVIVLVDRQQQAKTQLTRLARASQRK